MTCDEAIREAWKLYRQRRYAGTTSVVTIERAVDDDADYAVREYSDWQSRTPGWEPLLVISPMQRWSLASIHRELAAELCVLRQLANEDLIRSGGTYPWPPKRNA